MDKEILEGLGALGSAGSMHAAAAALSGNAEDYVNDATIEMAWAEKAFNHAEVYFKLISQIDSRNLKLTRFDDQIHEHFLKEFPNLDVAKLREDDLKSEAGKAQWREFCSVYEKQMEDYNFGTLLRLDVAQDYNPDNTIFALRVQFLAIEIARNRAGLNAQHLKRK
eukprot:m.227102 g.227102  ORF g.227102 m.227102 type:complete len:166 (+) comp11533_c0_seq1:3-500(+)